MTHLVAHDETVTALAWTSDACYLASVSEGYSLRLYSVLDSGLGDFTSTLIVELSTEPSMVRCLAFMGDVLVSGGEHGSLHAWDVARGGGGNLSPVEGDEAAFATVRRAPPV